MYTDHVMSIAIVLLGIIIASTYLVQFNINMIFELAFLKNTYVLQ